MHLKRGALTPNKQATTNLFRITQVISTVNFLLPHIERSSQEPRLNNSRFRNN
jgi:hypothetical protein